LNRPGCYPLHGQGERQGKDSAGGAAILRIPGVLSVNRQTTAVPAYDLLAIAGDILKGAVLRDLSRDHGSSSCGYIPHGEAARGWLIKELCAERLEDTPLGPRYVKTYQHNHRLDCAVYNRALGKWLIHSQAHAGGDVSAAAAAIGGSTA
jgi:phage terminase large subunit GpA-like protein